MDSKRILLITRSAEKFWLIASIVAAIATIWVIVTEGWERNQYMPLIPILAGLWYFVRRTFRKRLEREIASNN